MLKKNNPPKKEGLSSTFFYTLREASSRLNTFCQSRGNVFISGRHNVSDKAQTYLQGLLIKNPRKNMERIDDTIDHAGDYQSIQQFISNSTWDHEAVIQRNTSDLNELLGSHESVLNIDESCFSKKGKQSVGVARQYNGRLGKIDNCQVGVYSSLCQNTQSSLLDFRLYLPQQWCNDKPRCDKAHIPQEKQVFKTKVELAKDLLDSALSNDVKFGWVAADSFYGRDTNFSNYIESKGLEFVLDVPDDFTFYLEHPEPYLPRRKVKKGPKYKRYRSKAASFTAKELRAQLDDKQWQQVYVRDTTRGELHLKAIRQKVYVWKNDHSPEVQCRWLIITQNTTTKETSMFISSTNHNNSLGTLVQKHSCRFWIERNFEDAKTSVGMADYQARGWLGWHHHMSLVVLAMFFLLQERQLDNDFNPYSDGLLSCPDLVEILSITLPRRDRSVERVMDIIENRHRKRRDAIEYAKRKQRLKKILENQT